MTDTNHAYEARMKERKIEPEPGAIVQKLKGLEKEESLLLKPMPTTLDNVVALLNAIDVLREKNPEAKKDIDNIKGGVIQIARYLTNARLIITKAAQQSAISRAPQQGD